MGSNSVFRIVVVDETACQHDVPFLPGHAGQLEGDRRLLSLLEPGGLDALPVPFQQGADAGDPQLVAGLDVVVGQTVHDEGQHTPIDHVGAIALGGIFRRQVGAATSTRWQLAACSLAEPSPGFSAMTKEPRPVVSAA